MIMTEVCFLRVSNLGRLFFSCRSGRHGERLQTLPALMSIPADLFALCCSRTAAAAMENGFQIWSFSGQPLYK